MIFIFTEQYTASKALLYFSLDFQLYLTYAGLEQRVDQFKYIDSVLHCINTLYNALLSIHYIMHCINKLYCITHCIILYQYNVLYCTNPLYNTLY